jgi:hypothetical protein
MRWDEERKPPKFSWKKILLTFLITRFGCILAHMDLLKMEVKHLA